MRRALTLLLPVVVLAMGTPTVAAGAEPFNAALESEYRAALQAWGVAGEPIRCSSVDRSVVPMAELQANGRATQPEPGALVPCVLLIAAEVRPCDLTEVMLHEVGHLLGYSHSDNPASIMYNDASRQGYRCWLEGIERERSAIVNQQAKCRRFRPGPRYRWCWVRAREWRRVMNSHMAQGPALPTIP